MFSDDADFGNRSNAKDLVTDGEETGSLFMDLHLPLLTTHWIEPSCITVIPLFTQRCDGKDGLCVVERDGKLPVSWAHLSSRSL